MKGKRIALIAIASLTIVTACIALSGNNAAHTSVHGVNWHNDWRVAVDEAKETDRPILLLSMFGRLDEEVACANARTLRATLFKDPEFQAMLQQEVIPVWEMVREVPKVTIDLGDGKPIHRTVRGNAVMYLCNKKGEVLDVFPGVHTAKDLLPRLRESIKYLAKADTKTVLAFHTKLSLSPVLSPVRRTRITTGKAMMESPVLDLIGASEIEGASDSEAGGTKEERLFKRAAARLVDASLSPMTADEALTSLGMRREKSLSKEDLAMRIIEADSRRNIDVVRPVVHLWMASNTRLKSPLEARYAILEQMLKDTEEDHAYWLEKQLGLIEKLGLHNYLQSAMG